jgi:hypothetical protein
MLNVRLILLPPLESLRQILHHDDRELIDPVESLELLDALNHI